MPDPVTRAGWPVRVGMLLRRKKDGAHFEVVKVDREREDILLRRTNGRLGAIFVYNLSDRYEPVEEP